ncbi:hypothetical protein BLNAU_3626 [Blattamonas nauphoetae]|uniref:PSI domain-containing protein n=1 Tax=Blattamonas nauphoetae TaxID=2049346 RepID=A0ABQ9YD31_9EUKA|nr:hypothetical protein BLNAU_3626 [Blattamonas nauphoetae]
MICTIALVLSSFSILKGDGENVWTEVSISDDNFIAHAGTSVISPDDEKILVFGGHKNDQHSNSIRVFDTKAKTIISSEASVTARSYASWDILEGTAYLIGGKDASTAFADIYEYDISSKKFSQKGSLPSSTKICKHATAIGRDATKGEFLVIYGGENHAGTPSKSVFLFIKDSGSSFQPFKITIENKPNIPYDGCSLTFWKSNENVHYFVITGGTDKTKSEKVVFGLLKITINRSTPSLSSGVITPLPIRPVGIAQRTGHLSVKFGSHILFWGGCTDSSLFEMYSIEDKSYHSFQPLKSSILPPPLREFGFVSIPNDGIYVISGFDLSTNQVSNKIYKYKPDPCYSFKDCGTCAGTHSNLQCAWCASKHTCLLFNSQELSTETCDHLIRGSQSCVTCRAETETESSLSCSECISTQGCGWCQDTHSSPGDYFGCFHGHGSGPYVGSCKQWVYKKDPLNPHALTCESVKPTVSFSYPKQDQIVIPTESLAIQWEFDHDVVGFFNLYEVDLENPSKRNLIKDSITAAQVGNYMINFDESKNGKNLRYELDLFSIYDGSVAYTFKSPSFYVKTPQISFTHPVKTDRVSKNKPFTVVWKTDKYINPILLGVYYSTDTTNALQLETNLELQDGQFSWTIPSHLKANKEYIIIMRSLDTGIALAYSDHFTLRNDDSDIVITSPPESVLALVGGQECLIKWKVDGISTGTKQGVHLYNANNPDNLILVKVLSDEVEPLTEVKWIVDVVESAKYIIRVEDSDNFVHSDSHPINIEGTTLQASLTKNNKIVNTPIVFGETIDITWTYKGQPADFDIWAINETSKLGKSIVRAASKDGTFKWLVNDTFVNSGAYTIQIERADATTIQTSMGPLRLAAPGSIVVRSYGSFAALLVLATFLVVGFIVFYCIYFKSYSIGGVKPM